MESNADAPSPTPFSSITGKTSLLRTKRGRVVLPPVEALDGNRGIYHFSDEDLRLIYEETKRRRRWWRFWHYLRLALIALFLVWTFWLMPAAALHNWPFN